MNDRCYRISRRPLSVRRSPAAAAAAAGADREGSLPSSGRERNT